MIACFLKNVGTVFKGQVKSILCNRCPLIADRCALAVRLGVVILVNSELSAFELVLACDISLVDRYLGQLDSVADCDVGIVACNNNSALCINVADLSYRLFVCCDNLAVLNSKVECCIQYSVDVAIFIDSIQYVSSVICSCCLFKSVGAVSKLDRSALTDH